MAKPKRIAQFCLTAAVAVLAAGGAGAYPGALNLIPCTDTLGPNELRLAYESDGKNSPLGKDDTGYIFTQFGLTKGLEVGVDIYDVDGSSDTYLNAKYLVKEETGTSPSLAVGVMNVAKDVDTSYYAVSCKSFGKSRAHLGLQNQGGSTFLMLGADHKLNEKVSLLADWQTGSGRYHTLGVYWQATPNTGITLYGVRNNSSDLRDDEDFIGLNVAYTFPIR